MRTVAQGWDGRATGRREGSYLGFAQLIVLLAKDASAKLVGLGPSLPAVGNRIPDNTAGRGVGICV